MVSSLIKINEKGILDLLTNKWNDWANLAIDLEDIAFDRPYFRGMEWHHIEPDREQLVALWPLEHLAIHICHAWLNSTDKNHAAVAAFVKPFPGSVPRKDIGLSKGSQKLVLSFGQKRPSSIKVVASAGGKVSGPKNVWAMLSHPNTAKTRRKAGLAGSAVSLPKMHKFVQENKDQFGKCITRPKTSTGIWIEDDSGNRWEFPSIRTGSEYLSIPRRSLTKLVRGNIPSYKQFKGGQIGR
jgi:hypothetical protein